MKSTFKERWVELRAELYQVFEGFKEAGLARILVILLVFNLAGAAVLWIMEGPETFSNPFNAFWWALVTMTTVGYGDITPANIPGKIAAMLLMISGVVLVSFFTASVSSVMVALKIREGKGLRDVLYSHHLVVCGWHSGAENVVDTLKVLTKSGVRIVFINELAPSVIEDLLVRFKELKPKFVRGDYTSEIILKRAGLDHASCVLLLPNIDGESSSSQVDQKTILAALTIKEINPKVKIVAHALQKESLPHMRRGGVDKIVIRDAHTGYLLASHAVAPGIPEVINELLTIESKNRIVRMSVPKKLVGLSFSEAQRWASEESQALLIGIVAEEKVLEMDDILSGDMSSIDAFIKRKFEEAGRSTDELAQTRIKINPPGDQIVTDQDVLIAIAKVE